MPDTLIWDNGSYDSDPLGGDGDAENLHNWYVKGSDTLARKLPADGDTVSINYNTLQPPTTDIG